MLAYHKKRMLLLPLFSLLILASGCKKSSSSGGGGSSVNSNAKCSDWTTATVITGIPLSATFDIDTKSNMVYNNGYLYIGTKSVGIQVVDLSSSNSIKRTSSFYNDNSNNPVRVGTSGNMLYGALVGTTTINSFNLSSSPTVGNQNPYYTSATMSYAKLSFYNSIAAYFISPPAGQQTTNIIKQYHPDPTSQETTKLNTGLTQSILSFDVASNGTAYFSDGTYFYSVDLTAGSPSLHTFVGVQGYDSNGQIYSSVVDNNGNLIFVDSYHSQVKMIRADDSSTSVTKIASSLTQSASFITFGVYNGVPSLFVVSQSSGQDVYLSIITCNSHD